MREASTATGAPEPVGPYSAAVRAPSGIVYCSGQTPIDPHTGTLVNGGVAEQTRRVFENLRLVLDAAGSSFDDVVKVNVYLVDMADFAEMNAAYAEQFQQPFPARTTVAVAALPLGARVEVEMTAIAAA